MIFNVNLFKNKQQKMHGIATVIYFIYYTTLLQEGFFRCNLKLTRVYKICLFLVLKEQILHRILVMMR